MKNNFAILALSMLMLSCDSNNDGEAPLGSFDNGLLILNEGNAAGGSVTFVSNDLQTIQHDIFDIVNPDQSLGGYDQSMFFSDDKAFIISNFANKITVVDRYSFEYITSISTGFDHPRYGTVLDGKIYVTNSAGWESGSDDFLTVINLANYEIETPILVNDYAERIVAKDGKIYVANGSFSMGDSITVIDAATKQIVDTIELGIAPNSMEIVGSKLYALCNGFGMDSKLYVIDISGGNLNTTGLVFPSTMQNAFNLDIEGDYAYFNVAGKVYKMELNEFFVQDVPLFDTQSESDYIGYGFAVNGGRVYIAEATEDFSSDGKVYVYSTEGTFIDEIPAGLGPNGIYFNE